MDSVIDELSIIIDMIRKKENLKAIEKRGVCLITQLEANKNEEKEDEKLTTNFLAIQKRNEILQRQITDADVTINGLQKQIDDLKLEKQELKQLNLSLLDDKQNLEKILEKKNNKITIEKSTGTGTDLLILTKTREQELKNKIKELEKDIIIFDEKINEYDRYFNEKIFHFDYPPLKKYISLDDEIQYIQLDEKKKNKYCCFM